jgi:hypothetical protein
MGMSGTAIIEYHLGFPFFAYNFISRNNERMRNGLYFAKFRMFRETENMRNFVQYGFAK